jgi:DNA polymerase III sliding clamp (beta) subunit (PCNA family)
MTTFIELREIGETIGRFASVREKADRPTDRVIIQAHNGVLKLIAGDHEKTIMATVGPTDQDGTAIVSSRLFLTTLKALKGKGEVFFTIDKDGAQLKTAFGSSVTMDNIGHETPMLLRPKPFGDGPVVKFDAGFLPAASKYLDLAVGDFSPHDQVYGSVVKDSFWLRANDNHMGVEVGPLPASEVFDAHFPSTLFSALKGLEDAGGFYFPIRNDTQSPQVQIGSGRYRVVSVLRPGYGKLPSLPKFEHNVSISANRKTLIESFKSLKGRTEFNKVTLNATEKTLSISGAQSGRVEIEANVTGKGKILVDASLLIKALSTVDGTTVTVEYSDGRASLIRVSGDSYWPVILAPMKA